MSRETIPGWSCRVRMIILDTNFVSEPLRPAGSQAVRDWLNQQSIETLYLTTISLAGSPPFPTGGGRWAPT